MSEHDTVKQKHVDGDRRYRGRTDYLFVFLLIIALITALAAVMLLGLGLLSAFFNIALGGYFPDIDNLPTNRQIYVGAAVSILLAILFTVLARRRIQRNRKYQFSNGCPSCHKHDLIRIHRRHIHRQLAKLFRLPLRRYACRNCQWQGVLLFDYAEGIIFERTSSSLTDRSALESSALLTPESENLANPTNASPARDFDPDPKQELAPDDHSESVPEGTPPFVDETAQIAPAKVDAVTIDGPVPQELEDAVKLEGAKSRAIVIAPFGLSLRSEPNSGAETLRLLEPKSVVELLDPEVANSPANWRKVCYEGQCGWVSAAFLRHLSS